MMKALLATAVVVIFGLGYLAQDPTPVANQIRSATDDSFAIDPEEWLEEALAGVEAGNPFWESTYGVTLLNGSSGIEPLGDLVKADPTRGRLLVERAADKGLTSGLFLSWMFTGFSDDALLNRAVDLGDPDAIQAWLTRAYRTAECSSEGKAIFERALPSVETVSQNQETAMELLAEHGAGPYRSGNILDYWDKAYEEARGVIATFEAGIACDPEAGVR